ncbi:2-succinyl-5-enolpyruvyl-6-hydroxy-3-cyclohexene-1-carboxylic-acid synthase [Saliterribacillus persicus]|uniref:2-succinyl-5-enolpyruvyl-6-hydroxy-3-cyclohexene-1-carboxylate synthase n=1 Tax=Saliterribacillus persicus TaxID=930114 RepID=A0A368XG02_9BACI|nr:2-succinyl-5-enolpyruvyl-6-hydroxy-3-cyclohexene-1-carboxylic-acid synthase [Saliterribacillus persicus]RCW66921.1 2-succinyl-5-enolpyruvyl-6-hydroxy-3-cyclohexene-1-carboxylate synthase [Saliterribacillus persicus]
MKHTEILTRYVANFVDELVESGVRDIVISPGSRSTPLAMLCSQHKDLQTWIQIDERSAAFFALGIARESNRAVAVVCTSGTAAANYFPAIIEAYYSRLPILVLTADRPHELRDNGAPQAIDQIKMYGNYVKWFHEMALPEASERMLSYARNQAFRAVHTAMQHNKGPVHVNLPFREPLLPDFHVENMWGKGQKKRWFESGTITVDASTIKRLISVLKNKQRTIIVSGPQDDARQAKAILKIAELFHLPVFADPLSKLRSHPDPKKLVIESYDAFLKSSSIREHLQIDLIIRFGAAPVSKAYGQFVEAQKDVEHIIVEPYEGYREPTDQTVHYLYSDATSLLEQLNGISTSFDFDPSWLEMMQDWNEKAKGILLERSFTENLTEGHAVLGIEEAAPFASILFVGNSMPIRDVDTFFMHTNKEIEILANRGANGIDGVVSSAFGAAANGKRVTLLIGDISLLHDVNGLLLSKETSLNVTIVLINNNGGGIFSFLPQASSETSQFEALFGTPSNIQFEQIASTYSLHYHRPDSFQSYIDCLKESYEQNGISLIEVQTNREENVSWHRKKWKDIETILTSK